ncbi:beta-ketoacyl-ACP synthase II [Acidimicrobiaceae bacterium USS-CC1]|uniref:3-oxoacyl-[acyl-carrier-protein] synthase 2 n=1 Tax=Acidiferrimicrobium australe TaxID=2664430 RepID=A0ABW9QUT2_9ACTN|nr:beta-ketoacyl-ACP synthase II [Acidiferrimicrobium australe]
MHNATGRRVVVTGIGAISPLGHTADSTWDGLVSGRSGVAGVEGFDSADLPVRIAAQVRGFDPVAVFGKRQARHLDRVVQLALVATREAVESAKLDVAADPHRVGVVYGTGIGGLHSLEEGHRTLLDRGPDWINPYLLPMMIPNMAAGQIAMEWGIRGPSSCTITACSASAQAIGEASDLIRLGRADAVVCGGAEASITRLGLSGFAAMKALSTRNDEPERASRPFDLRRDGFVMGEAAATLVLEERDYALRRGAPILAELAGYGATSDAHHVTSPLPDGDGAMRAMLVACADAGIAPDEVGYINAHGTATPPNDRTEALAVRRIWGDRTPAISSTKSMTGHTLGAAGALESVACIKALTAGVLPPTVNLDEPDPDCAADHVALTARVADVSVAMSNSFGFGGHNASLVFRRA